MVDDLFKKWSKDVYNNNFSLEKIKNILPNNSLKKKLIKKAILMIGLISKLIMML